MNRIVADTLRIFGQGTKVVLEIVAMSADAGLIHSRMFIAVAGTAEVRIQLPSSRQILQMIF